MTAQESLESVEAERFYGSSDVARLVFGRSLHWFSIHRRRLESVDGFPRPISSIGRPRWNGQDLLDWIHRPKSHALEIADIAGTVVEMEERLRLRLAKAG